MSEENNDLRNEIFKTKEAVEGGGQQQRSQHDQEQVNPSGIQQISQEDAARKELGLELPVDAVPLPSEGKVYPPNSPLHMADHVEYRAMTAKEEDILMNRAFIKKGVVITKLIESCLVNKNVHVGEMLSGDRNAVMIAIRVSGYGKDYKPTFQCPNCEVSNELNVDLTELPVKNLEIEPSEPGKNLFYYKLPTSKKQVGFKFLTGDEEEAILNQIETKKKKGIQNEAVVTTRLRYSIVEVDGFDDQNKINKFIQYMPARDSMELRNYIDNYEPGVDMKTDFECHNCDYHEEVNMPMGASFFWPNART